MALGALMVVITDPLPKLLRLVYFPDSALNLTAVCRLTEVLACAATGSCVWFTVAFTWDRFVAICCFRLKARYCTERVATAALSLLAVLSCLECTPWYFVYEPEYVVGGVSWGCQEKGSYYLSAAWASYELAHLLLAPCVPFLLILLLNGLTVRHVLLASGARRRLRSGARDPELENRRRSLVLLFAITGSFVLLWLTKVTFHIYHRAVPYSYVDNAAGYAAESAGDMLQVLSTCTNTFVYTVTQSRFRQELVRGLTLPLPRLLRSLT
ncbi:prolactin-releasing peptide receptor-like [Pristis pectinata]|uniref:prolactin-releasing peptide receptor-like n=1 Tax=Pristis pectinata TaxID=685728 RepID=UPI00223D3611|nr:prolactin-releasing peptide receptor-like [Pristis pectinata]